jgi:hypothetical protein
MLSVFIIAKTKSRFNYCVLVLQQQQLSPMGETVSERKKTYCVLKKINFKNSFRKNDGEFTKQLNPSCNNESK